jgi:cytochrome c biogenesis protein CcmG, thiol:disulfide interchange protein DsbE
MGAGPPAGRLPRPPLWQRGQLVRLLGLFAVAVAATVVSFAIVSRIGHPLLPGGSPAPAITLFAAGDARTPLDVTGTENGRTYVVEFFETTCAVCQHEVKPLCDVRVRHPRVAFFSIDAARESDQAVTNFKQQQAGGCSDWVYLLDPKSTVLRSYSVTVVPTIYVIDGKGRVAYTGTGEAGVSGLDIALHQIAPNG